MKTFVKSNDWQIPNQRVWGTGWQIPYQRGWGNGYVIIPKGHRLHGKHYDEINDEPSVDVHGGLTFSKSASQLNAMLWPELNGDTDGWVVGFDTCHYGDNISTCTKEYVIKETKLLKKQLSFLIE